MHGEDEGEAAGEGEGGEEGESESREVGRSWLTEVEGCASHQVRLCGRINPALLDQLAVQVPRRREVPADARRHEAGLALRVRRPRLAASFFDQVCPAACSALKTETNSHTQRAGWEGGGGVLGGSQRATSSRPAAAASQSGVRPCRFGRSTSTRSCSTRWRATARCPVCSGVQQFSNSTSGPSDNGKATRSMEGGRKNTGRREQGVHCCPRKSGGGKARRSGVPGMRRQAGCCRLSLVAGRRRRRTGRWKPRAALPAGSTSGPHQASPAVGAGR